jgi:hypothetical protein
VSFIGRSSLYGAAFVGHWRGDSKGLSCNPLLRLCRHSNGRVGRTVLPVPADALNEFEEEASIERISIGVQKFPVVVLVVQQVVLP